MQCSFTICPIHSPPNVFKNTYLKNLVVLKGPSTIIRKLCRYIASSRTSVVVIRPIMTNDSETEATISKYYVRRHDDLITFDMT